jgi:hypothetical protein
MPPGFRPAWPAPKHRGLPVSDTNELDVSAPRLHSSSAMRGPIELPSVLLVMSLGACAGGSARPAAPVVGSSPAATTAENPAGTAPAAPAADPDACGGFECRLFPTPQAAFAKVLEANPLVLAIGEAHAQKGTEGVASSTRRFTQDLLPLLQGRASDLVVEVWAPDPRCQKHVAEVAEKQQPVTQGQAKTTKNEFVTLAEAARRVAVVPWPLRPTCEEYERIAGAGDDAVEAMLALTADVTLRTIRTRLETNQAQGVERMVAAYGGAMHNDLSPRPGRERYSYGPELARMTGGRYVELDIFVPEFIRDTDAWRAMPWFSHFDRTRQRDRTTLFRTGPQSFVLIFPHSDRSATTAGSKPDLP